MGKTISIELTEKELRTLMQVVANSTHYDDSREGSEKYKRLDSIYDKLLKEDRKS